MDILDDKNIDWKIINSYFNSDSYYFTNSQINSYNDFVLNKIPYTIKTLNPFKMLKNDTKGNLLHEVNVYIGGLNGENIYFGKPVLYENKTTKPLYPNEARLKDLNYFTNLYTDIVIEYITYKDGNPTKKSKIIEKYDIGKIPIMVHSNICILNNQPKDVLTEMGECPYDQGGYFIVSGREKVIISQERISTNKLFITKSKDPDYKYEGLIRCTSKENILFPKTINFVMYSEEYSMGSRKNAIILTCPNIDKNIPLFLMFRALGIESDKEILNFILYNTDDENNKEFMDLLRFSLIDSNYIFNQQQALEYLSSSVVYNNIDSVKYILINDFLPNVGKNFRDKAYFLGYLVNKLIKTELGVIKPTNKDNYLFKRVDQGGFLLTNLFRDFYNKLRVHIRNKIDREYLEGDWKNNNLDSLININNRKYIFDTNIITEGMVKSLRGNWGLLNDPIKMGIVQDLSRLSYLGYLSHVRRINTPLDRSTKLLEPHRLGGTQFGSACPIESPDGASIGLIKHYPVMTIVSYDIETDGIIECLRDYDMLYLSEISTNDILKSVKIFVNNNWIGIHFEPYKLYKTLKYFKRNGIINQLTSISWYIQENEIHIQTDSGRLLRPIYVVNKNELIMNNSDLFNKIKDHKFEWNDLIKSSNMKEPNFSSSKYHKERIKDYLGDDKKLSFDKLKKTSSIIEYIDIEESNTSLIAMNRKYLENKLNKYTHCEIDPSTILSTYTNVIPFADHNPYPRNAFSSKQGYAAIGVYATNFNNRIDTASYIIHYPQKALVHTKYTKYTHNDELPNGENVIVAIATYTGFNQEDSIIVNKNSIERGMFNITKFKSFINEEDKGKNEKLLFKNPLELVKNGNAMKFQLANWEYIDSDGIPKENSYIDEGDVILGKVKITTDIKESDNPDDIFVKNIQNIIYEDKSIIGDKTLKGFIDKVYLYKNEENMQKIKLRFRKTMKPELGDKMASRHGQKGVCGMIYAQEDMPFNKDGIVPDIIINPHAIPSRMTIGHLVECVLCKLGCKLGVSIDGTTFNNQNTKKLYNVLNKKEIHRYGDEYLYNGFTGEQMPCHIFFGPTYYYRLKHLVSDKVNYRNNDGPVTGLTKQPTKGRANNGGLRIGEMETNALLGHGIGSFLKESMMERSDAFDYYVDNKHGTIAVGNKENLHSSYKNDTTYDYSKVETPYSFKLLLQEIEAFSINTDIKTEENPEYDEIFDNDSLTTTNFDLINLKNLKKKKNNINTVNS